MLSRIMALNTGFPYQSFVRARDNRHQWKKILKWTLLAFTPLWAASLHFGMGREGVNFVSIMFGTSVMTVVLYAIMCLLGFLDTRDGTVNAAGVAGPYIVPLHKEIESLNTEVKKLERFVEAKLQLGIEITPEIAALLEKKIERLSARKHDVEEKLDVVKKLYGVQENEFDDLSDILFDGDPEAAMETRRMLEQGFRQISSRIEVEEYLLDIERIDDARRRKRK